MSAGIEVKVEEYDGTYACGFCLESVRGQPALKCTRCSSNSVHLACAKGTIYERQCATCKGETMAEYSAQEDAVPAVGGGVVAADVSRQGKCGGSSICQHNRIKSVARSAEGRASASTTGEGVCVE